MKFIDTAEIKIKAGDGGAGMSHFRREKFVPAGGPDGGNGGNGGNIYLHADEGLGTLLDFHSMRYYEAESGDKGGTNNRQGKTGETIYLKVPCGTVIFDSRTNEPIGEVLTHGSQLLVAKGGRGGIGNSVFATSRNQAPVKTIPPQPGDMLLARLELKMIADVGIIGAPNAGKSTLITVISAARPKVADYPFTTLVPTLGVVSHKDAPPFVATDIPGLIAGASEGKGLGHDFLRHVERTKVLVHLIDGSQDTAEAMISDYEEILNELSLYNKEILERPRLTVISKLDFNFDKSIDQNDEYFAELNKFQEYLKSKDVSYFIISSAMRSGIEALLDSIILKMQQIRDAEAEAKSENNTEDIREDKTEDIIEEAESAETTSDDNTP